MPHTIEGHCPMGCGPSLHREEVHGMIRLLWHTFRGHKPQEIYGEELTSPRGVCSCGASW